ncbi:EthD domain-containing protein [Hydrogenophaga sp.]|uniref:EthD domain-containing protein n=1 Tax=Hydrogenophaga sp. TaxID=1904254 RepID=UPI0026034AA2|nr:EthD domain-containing protein [Hydrogenophaga sp.]MCW5656008.1 EthD domain-containing protein [Hydrogenophaga sp.]
MNLTKFSLLRRRADLAPAAFAAHWRSTHVRVLTELGGHAEYNRRYVQNRVLREEGVESAAFDGVAQMLPRSEEVLQRGLQEDPRYLRHVRPDESLFLDVERCVVLYCRTEVLQPHDAAAPWKWLALLMRDEARPPEAFALAWREACETLRSVAGAPEGPWSTLRGLSVHEVLPGAARGMAAGERGGAALAYGAVLEMRFASVQALRDALAAPDAGSPRGVVDRWAGVARCHGLAVHEDLIYDLG